MRSTPRDFYYHDFNEKEAFADILTNHIVLTCISYYPLRATPISLIHCEFLDKVTTHKDLTPHYAYV